MKLVDPNGNATTWDYDVQGRVTQETRADASHENYIYETTSSRLKQKTDRKNVTTTFAYFLDGKLKQKTYSDTTPARELHLQPGQRADAHRRQRHGHPHLDLRRHGPRRHRGQHEERLDAWATATTMPAIGRCSHSERRDPRQLRLRPAEPPHRHHASVEHDRLRLRHSLTPHVDDLPERRRDHLRLRHRIAPDLDRREQERHADHELRLHPGRRRQPHPQDHSRLGRRLQVR